MDRDRKASGAGRGCPRAYAGTVEAVATRQARVGAVVGGVLAVLAATVLGVAGAVPDLLDPGAVVRWGAPAATVLAELAGAVTLGALVLAAVVLPVAPRRARADGARLRTADVDGSAWPAATVVAAVAAGVWTVAAVADLVLGYARIAGRPLTSPTFGQELGLFVSSVSLGRIGLGVVVVAALTCVVAMLVTSPVGAVWAGLLAAVALALQAQTGHAAGTSSHELATSTMFLHLLSASVWVGGLATLAVVASRLGRDLVPSVARFSTIAAWCYLGVAVSGLLSATLRLGTAADLTTRYGVLVLVKAALLAILGVLGWLHRRAVLPRLADATTGRAPAVFWRFVALELAVLGAVSGVAVALAGSEPPESDALPTDPTSAEIVTGHPLPPAPTADQWLTGFRWDALTALAALAGVVVYVRWVRRLAARGDRWPVGRTVSWLVGMAVFVWASSGGPAVYGHVLLSAHMIEHMVLMLVVPVFLVLAAPVTLAVRALPVRADGSRGPRELLLGLVHSRWAQLFAFPLVAAVNFAASMYVFYLTDLFALSLTTYVGHVAMVVHFSLVGYLFVNGMIGIDPGPTRPSHPMRLVLLFATMAVHAFFGVALTMDESLLVPEWFGLLGRTWGPSALADQQTAGAIVWGISELPMLAVAIVLAVGWTRADERTARRRDRAADRDGDPELTEYNAMLARMAERDTHG